MYKMYLTLLLSAVSISALAQTSDSISHRGREVKVKNLDPSDTYEFADGQKATPTGHEAGSAAMGGEYIFDNTAGDTARVESSYQSSRRRSGSKGLSERKIYDWKNGQSATPSGEEAAPVGGGYASLRSESDKGTRKDLEKNKRSDDNQ